MPPASGEGVHSARPSPPPRRSLRSGSPPPVAVGPSAPPPAQAAAARAPIEPATPAVAGVASIVANGDRTCTTGVDATVRCWGGGPRSVPVHVPEADASTHVALGPVSGRCAVASGQTRCASLETAIDGDLAAFPGVVEIALAGAYGCLRTAQGAVACWGAMSGYRSIESDDGTGFEDVPIDPWTTPHPMRGVAGATQIDVGGGHACALVGGGAVRCWGEGSSGQLGDGRRRRSTRPVSVAGIAGARAIALGDEHACALLADGTVRCWGDGRLGALGVAQQWRHATPVAVPGVTGAVAIAAAASQTCALLGDGGVACWGVVLGWEGDVVREPRLWQSPARVPAVGEATAIALGRSHGCALLRDATVRCWGANDLGQLGDGTALHRWVEPGELLAPRAPPLEPATPGPALDDASPGEDPSRSAGPLAEWVRERVARARAGGVERVRLPVAYRSDGWGCDCPTSYIGNEPDVGQGPFLRLRYARGVEEPVFDPESGGAVVVEGRFTGRTQRRVHDETPYVLHEVEVTRVLGLESWLRAPDDHEVRVYLLDSPSELPRSEARHSARKVSPRQACAR